MTFRKIPGEGSSIPDEIVLTSYLPRHLVIGNSSSPFNIHQIQLGLKKSKTIIPYNLEWLIATAVEYRIPRVAFLAPGSNDTDEIADNCFLQDFNTEPQEILMNYEYEYIEVRKIRVSKKSQLCLGVFSLLRILSNNLPKSYQSTDPWGSYDHLRSP